MVSVFPGDAPVGAPVEDPVWVEVVAAVDPAFDFVGKSHPAVGYTDYTRKVTCLIEIGLN